MFPLSIYRSGSWNIQSFVSLKTITILGEYEKQKMLVLLCDIKNGTVPFSGGAKGLLNAISNNLKTMNIL